MQSHYRQRPLHPPLAWMALSNSSLMANSRHPIDAAPAYVSPLAAAASAAAPT